MNEVFFAFSCAQCERTLYVLGWFIRLVLKSLNANFVWRYIITTQCDTGVRLNLYEMDITALFEKSCVLSVVLSFYFEGEVEDFFSGGVRCSPLSGTKVEEYYDNVH